MGKVTITIDGQRIEAEEGARLLDVALQNGVHIPHLCYFEGLTPYAGCRTCVVEIEGVRGTPVSCTTTVTEGLIVRTKSPQIDELRHGVMEFILCDHPGRCFDCHRLEHCGPGLICLRDEIVTERCLTCAKNRFCELQEVAEHINMRGQQRYYEEKQSWYGEKMGGRQVMRIIRTNPFIELEFDKCILCTRCVRVCDEIRGRGVFTLSLRGPEAKIDTAYSLPMQDTDCEFCGACIDVCPTAAIMDKTTKWVGIADKAVETICAHCSVGCGIKIEVKKGKIVQGKPWWENPVSKGQMCVKGRHGLDYVQNANRLKTPLIKKNGQLQEATWGEAIELVANKLAAYKGDQFAAVTSPHLTNEDSYLIQKFTRVVMGTNNIDNPVNLTDTPAALALASALGYTASTNSYEELVNTRCILAFDSSPTETHPVIGVKILDAVRKKGARLILASPDRPELYNLCGYNALWLQHRPGTELALLGGMLRVIIDEGLANEAYIQERCGSFDAFKQGVSQQFSLEASAQITGVPAEQIAEAARTYAQNSPAAIVFPAELAQMAAGNSSVLALIDLALATGNIGRRFSGLHVLESGGNACGINDVGCTPACYPGYQRVDNPKVSANFSRAWGVSLSEKPGLHMGEMIEAAASGSLKAMLIVGEDLVRKSGAPARTQEALGKLDFLVVQDIFLSETAKLANVVLPGATFVEKDGTMTNNERRLQRLRQVINPIGEAKPDWLIIAQLAQQMGAQGFAFENVAAILNEIAGVAPIYAGVSYSRLGSTGLQWPVPDAQHPGTELLYEDGFESGKGSFVLLDGKKASRLFDGDYPFVLTSLWANNELALSKNDASLVQAELAELSATDAAALGIRDGDRVRIASRHGRIEAKACLSDEVPRGTVALGFLLGEKSAALLPQDSGPSLTAVQTAVRLEKAIK